MVNRTQVNQLVASQKKAVQLAVNDMKRAVGRLSYLPADLQYDMLVDIVSGLVSAYGNVAATAAAEWYRQARIDETGEDFDALTFGSFNPDKAFGSPDVQKHFATLDAANMQQVQAFLEGAMQRWITYYGRETVARNIRRDPKKPRWARVPSGAKTCAFCELLASRGFVYHSKETAGALKQWHSHCDCMIVPSWDRELAHIAGYDPDAYYKRYQQAYKLAQADKDVSANNVTHYMRKLFPGQYTDNTSTKHGAVRKQLPHDVLNPTSAQWEHIFINHRYDSTVPNKTRFADTWDDDKIKTAVIETIIDPDIVVQAGLYRKQLYKIVDEEVIRVWLQKTKQTHGKYKLHTAHRILGQERGRRWAQIEQQRESMRDEKL